MNPLKYYSEDGSLYHEAWSDEEGLFHREDGPAHIWYYEDGVTIESEYWYRHSKSHRLDGPAIIHYYKDGSIYEERWFVDGEELTKDQILAHKRNLTINKLLDQ